jgi:hypothetical protein
MWFNKQKPSVTDAESQFDADLRVFLSNARRSGVRETYIVEKLGGVAEGIKRCMANARELRNHRLEGNAKVVSR